jgi:anti-sigma regulatory factor (Ser/Thr protein kinase)
LKAISLEGDMLLILKNNINEIGRLAEEIERFGEEENLPLKTTLNLNLVLEELITNTISYGYSDSEEHLISVKFERIADSLTVTIEDDGSAFNPLEEPPPVMSDNLDDLEPGGLGIHLVRKLTDQVFYQREGGCNILKLVIKLPAA